VGSTSGRMFAWILRAGCSNRRVRGASHWNPDTLVTPVLSFEELACFSRKNNENEERANG